MHRPYSFTQISLVSEDNNHLVYCNDCVIKGLYTPAFLSTNKNKK